MDKPLIRPTKEMQRIDNLAFNKNGSKKDEDAWLAIEDYIIKLENLCNSDGMLTMRGTTCPNR